MQRMRLGGRFTSIFRSCWLAGLIGISACSSTPETKEDEVLEIYSWWTNPGEADALEALLALYNADHPGVSVINTAVSNFGNATEQLRTRMLNSSPPDSFQAMGGWDLLQWVTDDGRDDSGSKLEPLDFLSGPGKWTSVLPKSILESVSVGSHMYGVPVGVHRYNVLFYNKKVFEDNGVTVPTSLEELFSVSDTFKSKDIVPIALGSKAGWPLTLMAFDGVLIAQAGSAFRASYLDGKESPDDARIGAMLDETVRLLDYTNADHDALDWDEAAAMVIDGRAAMTMMGDWAKGFFLSQGMRPDIELGQVPIPGTAGTFVYLVDSFGLPRGAENRQAAADFLDLLGSSKAQGIFNPIKGSTPPRIDADRSLYDALAQKNIEDLKTNVLTSWAVQNPEFVGELDATMKQLGIDGNIESVQRMLENRYDWLANP